MLINICFPSIGVLPQSNQAINLLLAKRHQIETGRQDNVGHEVIDLEVARLVAIGLLAARDLKPLPIVVLDGCPGGVSFADQLDEDGAVVVGPWVALLEGLLLGEAVLSGDEILGRFESGEVGLGGVGNG